MTRGGERRSRLAPPKPLADPREADQRAVDSVLSRARTRDADEVSPTPGQLREAAEVRFTMTLDPETTALIDRLRKHPVKVTRRHWIRQAIREKILRDIP